MLRYILLLEDIFKHTENNDEDKRTAEQAISVIKLQSKEANLGVSVTESKVKCREYHRGLITKNGDPCVRSLRFVVPDAEADIHLDRKSVV